MLKGVCMAIAGTAVLVVSLGWGGAPPWALNEVRTGDPEGGGNEYLELSGFSGASLDDVTHIVLGDDDVGDAGSGVVEAVVPLTGQVIRPDGFFVVAEPSFTIGTANLIADLNFEDGDNVTHLLVWQFTGSLGDDLDVDDNGTLDVEPWSFVVDCIALVGPGTPGVDGDHVYCDVVLGPDGESVPVHGYRCTFSGAWTLGEADLADPGSTDSPGSENASCSFVPPCGASMAGDCFEANGTPFCDDLGCCELVVQIDPLCAFKWTQSCADIAAAECATPCPGDCGGTPDGVVDTVDFLELLAQWGQSGTSCDFKLGNPGVDTPDFLELLSAWGVCP